MRVDDKLDELRQAKSSLLLQREGRASFSVQADLTRDAQKVFHLNIDTRLLSTSTHDMAEQTRKRRAPSEEPNWVNDGEMERMRELKRRKEEAEHYNEPAVRRRTREVGKREAQQRQMNDPRLKQAAPRGLAIEGSSSSEFVSDEEVEDMSQDEAENETVEEPLPIQQQVESTRQRKRKRQKEQKRQRRAAMTESGQQPQQTRDPDAARRVKKKARRKRRWERSKRAAALPSALQA